MTEVKRRTLLKLGILCVALGEPGQGVTTPALGAIMAAMPTVSPSLIQMIPTVPPLFVALIPFLYFKLVDLGVKKRTLLALGAILFLVGGVGPFFFHNSIWVILCFRALVGMGTGIILPLSGDLVIDFFEGHERHSMQGLVGGIMSIGAAVMSLLGGFFAGINWTYCFLAYLVVVIFFVIAFVLVPEPDRKAKIAAQEGIEDLKNRAKLPGSVYLMSVMFALYALFWYVCPTNAAIILMGEGLANPSQLGLLFMAMSLAGFVVALFFGALFKKIKFGILLLVFLAGAIGSIMQFSAHTLTLYAIGFLFTGASMGIATSGFVTKVTSLVPYSAGAAAIAIVYVGFGIGGFLQPIVFKFFGSYSMGRPAFLIAAIGMVVCALLMTIINSKTPAISTKSVSA